LPLWAQYILGAAAIITALGVVVGLPFVIWRKIVKPTATLIVTTDDMLPLLRELTRVFKDAPDAFLVLNEIQKQFRSDSGSSLRDVVNRLETAAQLQHVISERQQLAAETLKVGVEAARLLSQQDRLEIRELLIELTKVGVRVDAGAATSLRNEAATNAARIEAASINPEK
jgi:BMFP domain-containing protein YqiC